MTSFEGNISNFNPVNNFTHHNFINYKLRPHTSPDPGSVSTTKGSKVTKERVITCHMLVLYMCIMVEHCKVTLGVFDAHNRHDLRACDQLTNLTSVDTCHLTQLQHLRCHLVEIDHFIVTTDLSQ